MMKLSGQKTRIIIGAELFIAAGLLFFVILPSWQQIDVNKKTIIDRRVSVVETEQLAERSNDLIRRSAELDEKIESLQNKLLDPSTALDFLTELEAKASAVGIALDVRTFEQADPKTGNGKLSLSASGTFQNTLSFVHQLERLTWLIKVQSLTFAPGTVNNRSQTETDTDAVTVSIEASTFWKGTQ